MVPRNDEQKERYEKDKRNFEKCKYIHSAGQFINFGRFREKCMEMYAYDAENEALLDKLSKMNYEKCK